MPPKPTNRIDRKNTLANNEPVGIPPTPAVDILVSDDDDDDDEPVIQKSKEEKPKRQLTERQRDALEKGKQKRRENVILIREQKQKQEEEYKRRVEEKILQKAISIKKKEIKKEALIDAISDDETPIEEIKAIKKRQQKPREQPVAVVQPQPPKPKYYFV